MTPTTQKGFLVIADITGFTPFLATTELEHSQEILQHMLKGLISLLTPALTLAEVEGDAVFVYSKNRNSSVDSSGSIVDIGKFNRRDRILDIVESAYFAFRDRKTTYNRIRSCGCKACQMASTLDIKFILHYGDYIMNHVGGKDKPLGPAVNVAHRLLKNHVTEATGWNAYALFSKECLDAIQTDTEKFHHLTETYEHIGTVDTYSINLDQRYKDFASERRVFVEAADTDYIVQKEFPVSPPILWEWANDPKKRTMWSQDSDWQIVTRSKGRTGKGSTNHCVKSKVVEKVLDYRPFNYYTSAMGRSILNFTLTVVFEEIPSGTRLSWHVKMNSILPKVMRRAICHVILMKGMRIHIGFEKLFQLVSKEAEAVEAQA